MQSFSDFSSGLPKAFKTRGLASLVSSHGWPKRPDEKRLNGKLYPSGDRLEPPLNLHIPKQLLERYGENERAMAILNEIREELGCHPLITQYGMEDFLYFMRDDDSLPEGKCTDPILRTFMWRCGGSYNSLKRAFGVTARYLR